MFDDDFMAKHWAAVDRKYDILAEQARAATTQAQTEAATLPGLRAAQSEYYRGAGQHAFESAREIAEGRNMTAESVAGMLDQLVRRGIVRPPSDWLQQTAPGGGPVAPATPGSTTEAGPRPPTPLATLPGQGATTPDTGTPTAKKMSFNDSAVPSAQNLALIGTDEDQAEGEGGAPYTPLGAYTPSLAEQQPTMDQINKNLIARGKTPFPTAPARPSSTRPRTVSLRRGIANVKPQGYAAGDADIRRRFLTNASPLLNPLSQASNTPAPGSVKPALPTPPPGPGPGEQGPAPIPAPGPSVPMSAVPAQQYQPTGTWPGGEPRGFQTNPNATTGIDNLAGIVDTTTRMVNPEAFNRMIASSTPSTNVEDRRGQTYDPTSLASRAGNVLSFLDRTYNPMNPNSAISSVAGSIKDAIMGSPTYAPGSLEAQAGMNSLGSPGLAGSISSALGLGSSTAPGAAPSNITTPASSPTAPSTSAAPVAFSAPAAPAALAPSAESIRSTYRRGTADVKGKKPQGLKKGSASVKGKGGGGSKPSKGGGGDGTQPGGLEGLLTALAAAQGGAGGPQAANGVPPRMAPGAAAPPGFAQGMSEITPPPVPPLMPMTMPRLLDTGFARGTRSVEPANPFSAVFGANAVPGQGTGTVDTVPAMLAPHEAVLNRAAADMLGRGVIASLNARGARQMGMGRGTT